MSSTCLAANCQCAEKSAQIVHFKSQIDHLLSQKLVLHTVNLNLQEHLDDCTQELKARLSSKEDEAQTLRRTFDAMSSHALVCHQKTVALQEELVKKEKLLQEASSANTSLNCPLPEGDFPRSMHSVSIQTSPLKEETERTVSCTSEDFRPSSDVSEVYPYLAEVQELRYTVQVLKQQLEELHSTPTSPSDTASGRPCASLADMLEWPPSTPLSGRNTEGSCPDQVLHALLVSELHTTESIARQAIELEYAGALRAVQMLQDWFLAQQQLLLGGLEELQELEASRRDHLEEAEKQGRSFLSEETGGSPQPVLHSVQSVHSPVGFQALSAALVPRALACEAMGRTAVALEEECGREALTMCSEWLQTQTKLHVAAIAQLTTQEGAERSLIIQVGEVYWGRLREANLETPQTPQTTSSAASSVGEDLTSRDNDSIEELSVLCEHSVSTPDWPTDGPRSHLSVSKPCLGPTAMQLLVNRQQHAWRLLVQQESSDFGHLLWLREVEITQCLHNDLLLTQLSHGRLAVKVEAAEAEARDALRELFEAELLECLRAVASRRGGRKVLEMWENERWTPMSGWSRRLLQRPHFSDVTGKVALDLSVFDSLIAWENLSWCSEGWELDLSSSVDPDGWQYAFSFLTPFLPSPWIGAHVRRRKWVRTCEPLPVAKPADIPPAAPAAPVSSYTEVFGEPLRAGFIQ
eukprot:GGOE01048828.1.p1 GENE.GGOE01048828.1~~GGOE01048828.1.p1  ORF type:complete len:706 (-),score=216.35 GGOE01048828.1:1888-3969(-)